MYGQKIGIREKIWGIFHPVAAIKIKKLSKQCYTIYKNDSLKNELDNFENGGKLDAFRHIFFMASFAQKVNGKKLLKLGQLHEKFNYKQFLNKQIENAELPDSLSSVMDLYNNKVGVLIGKSNKKLTLQQLKTICIKSIVDKGEALIMLRNKNGYYLNCKHQEIKILPVWNIDKCLVKSNEG